MLRMNHRIIRQFFLFAAVAETGSISRAAERMHISQPVLTMQIRDLEDQLGYALFERLPRGMKLSPRGQALLPKVKDLIAHAELLGKEACVLAEENRTILSVGAIHDAMLHWCPWIRRRLLELRPDISLVIKEISSAEMEPMLLEQEIDLAIGFCDRTSDPAVGRFTLVTERPVLIVPLGHPLAGEDPVAWEDLEGEQFVFIHRDRTPQYFDALIGECRAHGLAPAVIQCAGSPYEQIANVACGQRIGLLPETFRSHLPKSVVAKTVEGSAPCWTLSLVWSEKTENPARDDVVGILRQMDLPACAQRI